MLPSRIIILVVAITTIVLAGGAQTTSCVNEAPNPYHVVDDWAHTPRPFAAASAVYVDTKDNVWILDRPRVSWGARPTD